MLLWCARKVSSFKAFTEDQKFHKYYLSSNTSNSDSTPSIRIELGPSSNNDNDHTNPSSTVQPYNESPPEPHIDNRTELSPSNASATASSNASHDSSINPTPTDEQTSVSTFIENVKEYVKRKTERSDDRDPFCPKPGEGSQRDQTLDQIYTNLVIHKGRVNMHDLIPTHPTPHGKLATNTTRRYF